MAKATKHKERRDVIIGFCAIALSAVLLITVISGLNRFRAQLQQLATASKPNPSPSATVTLPSTGPNLIPNPYASGDFVYEKGYLTCLAGASLLGVDVSEYQGKIDWSTVAAQGIRFAMIRIGARGWGEAGNIITDARWEENLAGAQAAGLMTGVYFFSQAISEAEAREEARFVLEKLDGRALSMPVVFDWEIIDAVSDPRTADLSPDMLNRCAIAFCEEIRAGGYEPMVYFNLSLANDMLNLPLLQQQGYAFWLAMYTGALAYPHRVEMWQYTSGGSVPGINGLVDLDLYFTYD